MNIGILGSSGRAGFRHGANAMSLGHSVLSYDSAGMQPKSDRQYVLENADAIVIATPAHCHLTDLKDCIAAGKPTLVEKPIALVGQSKEIAELDLSKVAVGFNLRFHDAARLAIKDAYYAQFVCCQYSEQQEPLINGVVNDWLCHELDLAMHLLGPLRLIDHHADRFRADLMLTNWETKCRVHVHSDMRAKQEARWAFVASDEVTDLIDFRISPVTNEQYQNELEAFIDFAQGKPSGRLATGQEGLEVLRMCERVANLHVGYDQ